MPTKSSKPKVVREDERVMVFIDGSNLYHVLSQGCGRHDLQFDKFSYKLANGRSLQRTYYYNIRQESETNPTVGTEQQKFLDSLYDTPYVEVRLGIWKQRGDVMVEKGVDVMLATDLVVHAYKDHYDTAIVVSGDADFYPALQAVKDVGKHIEVAAFDMNMSSESARVADSTIKFTKSYFTGLWMTRAQARARAAAASKPEVSDEAASPNGEDKAATKATSSRRTSSTRKSTSSTTRTRKTATNRTRKPASKSAAAAKNSSAAEESSEPATPMRRTPTRRRVGGGSTTNGNGRSAPRPPALRSATAVADSDDKSSSEGNSEESTATRRRSWRGRLGLSEE
ncbi:MAG: NYN domain-containing protein [Dehalococcoidia bacterium]